MSKQRILVIKLGALGDHILAMDAYQAIRRHHADGHVVLLTRTSFLSFAKEMPWFDEIVEDPSIKPLQFAQMAAFRRRIRKPPFHRIYDLQGNDRARLYLWLLGAFRTSIVRSSKGSRGGPSDVSVREKHLRVLDNAGVPRAGDADLSWLDDPLDDIDLPSRFALIAPGCAPQHPIKRWPPEHYAALCDGLRELGITSIAVGTETDRDAILKIRLQAPHVIDYSGKTNIPRLAALARRAITVVGNDTGPMHIAAVVGAPTLVVMSRVTDPVRMLPQGPDVRYLKRENLAELPPAEVIKSIRLRAT